ncbi:Ig-like domain-containing protein [Bifidobacterium sp. CP2]|uniref:Ig-like domain-containing protein n=1 Tax=Bifidobacterium sp. CP2 TaxID=2809025 RepID=UPI001BDCA690|nr:Ig-like domain-containing protein [Bifidobacterium sp. CP2]MBT1180715.1 Ig-like domain-containing protein [Bifidobacterium sp. CP2]
MSRTLAQRIGGGIVAALASAAMLFSALPAQAAGSNEVGADATSNANIYQALQYMQQLNELRANKNRRPLTNAQIAAAMNADNNTNSYSTSNIAADTADGSAVGALNVNSDMMKWAQTRANELIATGDLDAHKNMYNGKPSWYACADRRYPNQCTTGSGYNLTDSDKYQSGTTFFGPEALAWSWTSAGGLSGNAVDSWYSELNYEIEHPNASASELAQWRQGYGHYLTEVSPLADIAGVAVAVKDGVTITVLEIGNSKSAQGKTQSVEDALQEYAPKKTITGVSGATLDVLSGTEKPTNLPTTVTATYDDKSTAQVPVTWNAIPDDWNQPRTAHQVTIKGKVDGWKQDVTLTLNVAEATVTSATLADGTTSLKVTTPSGTNPAKQLPDKGKIVWSNGDETEPAITWTTSDQYKDRNGGTYDLTGTIAGTKATVTAHVTVEAATVKAVAQPAALTVVQGGKPSNVPPTVKVTWSNGDTTDEAITWNTGEDPADATFDQLGEKTFHGTAAGQPVTLTVKVVEATVTTFTKPADITVVSGTEPKLPDKVTANLSNGQTDVKVPVTWTPASVPESLWKALKGGTQTFTGVVNGQADKTVTITVTVTHATITTATVTPDTLSTPAGLNPTDNLPKTATITWSNGETGTADVKWDTISDDQYQTADKTFTLNGTASNDGQTAKVMLPITVTAPAADSATATKDAVETIAGTAPKLDDINAKVTYTDGSNHHQHRGLGHHRRLQVRE